MKNAGEGIVFFVFRRASWSFGWVAFFVLSVACEENERAFFVQLPLAVWLLMLQRSLLFSIDLRRYLPAFVFNNLFPEVSGFAWVCPLVGFVR